MPYPCPNICWVMPTTIPSFGSIAKIASRLAQEDGFGLSVLDGKTRLIGRLGTTSEKEEEQIRLFFTEVVDRMHSRGSSSSFITNGQRFMVVQRLRDLDEPKSFHFSLSTLIGNAGPLDLNTPSDDLSLAHQPNLLTELPDIGREIWVMLMEYGGKTLEDVYDAFSGEGAPSARRELLRQYERLHQANVLHQDIDIRHWLQRPGEGWMIIDFDGARELTGAQEDKEEKEEEMRRVNFELPQLNRSISSSPT
ncbi:hypothetical protein I350_07000 [Cryptococcus amylolentus CBS 6273]|uniref:Protein kinase domain-containing protein n=1 Tax=Cryptococcus amylolentus CBS 6273 TaxID=1296118 RepID=A0A1E3JHJ3_9TREE|nr:hypothetical protein I350_07000 [Cryptococcus amylolentus CBS 6273]